MRIPTQEEFAAHLQAPYFRQLTATIDALGLEGYIVGGYVRDYILKRPSKDVDVVVVGSGIEAAEAYAKALGKGAHCSVFRNFGTAQVKWRHKVVGENGQTEWHEQEIEFVGARKESYSHDSRKPNCRKRYTARRPTPPRLYHQCVGGLSQRATAWRTH